jgi:hypothetical protein
MDLIILAVLAIAPLLGIAALLGGVDSRPSFVDPRVGEAIRPNI